MRHAHFFHPVREELSENGPAKLHEHITRVRKEITSLIEAGSVNGSDPMFRAFDADLPMQANYDAHTVVARLYECKAKFLLFHSLSCGGRLTPRCARQVTELLELSKRKFDACKFRWWHGYDNFVLTEAVAEYAQGRREASRAKLHEACTILRETHDLWRVGQVAKILNKMSGSRDEVLSQTELEQLLFDE